jgi:hypothetical protein
MVTCDESLVTVVHDAFLDVEIAFLEQGELKPQ